VSVVDGCNRDQYATDNTTLPGVRRVVFSGASTPTIATLTAVAANTEYSYTFPASTKGFRLNHRTGKKVLIAFISGQSGVSYVTIWPGTFLTETSLDVSGLTIYYQSPTAGSIVEVLSWA
jgi:hypothetical protein